MTEVIKKQNTANSNEGFKLTAKNITQIVYFCQALSFIFGLSFIVGVIINYIKKDEVKGTWLESHFRWQIRTFWFGLLWAVIGFVLSIVIIGFLIIAADIVWIFYRVIKGWLALIDEKSPTGLVQSSGK